MTHSSSDSKPPSFPTTDWTIVASTGTECGAALTELVKMYRPALLAFLTFERRIAFQNAEDLLQGFLADRIVEGRLFERADQTRGRLRSLLLRSLVNYIAVQKRFESTAKRGAKLQEPLDGVDDAIFQNHNLNREFDRAWARELLIRTRERMREECHQQGRRLVWEVFERRVLVPCDTGVEPAGYAELVSELGFQSPLQVANTLVTAKRMFDRILRLEVARYAPPDQIDDEIRDLYAAFESEAQGHPISRLDIDGGLQKGVTDA